MTIGEKVTFRRFYERRNRSGIIREILPDGRLRVQIMHRAARGGAWIAQDAIVKPGELR